MTTPPLPSPVPGDWVNEVPAWCRTCEVHQATARKPTCPVCLDDERLEDERLAREAS